MAPCCMYYTPVGYRRARCPLGLRPMEQVDQLRPQQGSGEIPPQHAREATRPEPSVAMLTDRTPRPDHGRGHVYRRITGAHRARMSAPMTTGSLNHG
jgi:hypothetical protein